MEDLLKVASSQGIWAALSVTLIYYVIKAQEKKDTLQNEKEQKYQDIISKLTEEFNVLKEIQNDIYDIKNHINK